MPDFNPINDESLAFVMQYISLHKDDNIDKLRLKAASEKNRRIVDFAIDQIDCRRRFAGKLPNFTANPLTLFPSMVAGQQSSNESVARYNASVAGSGRSALDMTSGLGADAMALAYRFESVEAYDIDSLKSDLLAHNATVFGMDNLKALCGDSVAALKDSDGDADGVKPKYSLIFVDPARRDGFNRKLVSLTQCQPDIVDAWSIIRSHGEKILVKASPMLDVTTAMRELEGLTEIHAVSYKGECKELLLVAEAEHKTEPNLTFVATDLDDDVELSKIIFRETSAGNFTINYCDSDEIREGGFILIPNASVMKLGRWKDFSAAHPELKKVSPNTHLYFSLELPESFEGRIYQIKEVLNSKSLKKLKGRELNVVTRNYPLDAAALTRKTGVKSGSDEFLLAFRTSPKELPTAVIGHRM